MRTAKSSVASRKVPSIRIFFRKSITSTYVLSGKLSSIISTVRISSVSVRRSETRSKEDENCVSASFSLASLVTHLSSTIRRILSKPTFCSKLSG